MCSSCLHRDGPGSASVRQEVQLPPQIALVTLPARLVPRERLRLTHFISPFSSDSKFDQLQCLFASGCHRNSVCVSPSVFPHRWPGVPQGPALAGTRCACPAGWVWPVSHSCRAHGRAQNLQQPRCVSTASGGLFVQHTLGRIRGWFLSQRDARRHTVLLFFCPVFSLACE